MFFAQTGDTDLQQKDVNGKGCFFVNSGIEGQGIKGKTDKEARTFESNTITIDFWGNAYYRDFRYKMATHNHVFSLSGAVIKNREIGLYLVSAMAYMRNLFSYNSMGTWTKIKKLCIHLPITPTGEIDFAYMESRIREMEESRIREMDAYLKAAGFDDCVLTEEEQLALNDFASHKFESETISTIFDVKKGKRLTKDNMVHGPINFVGSTASNNGITAKVSNSEYIHEGNKITVSYNGSVGEAFYQTDKFWASDDVNVLTSKQPLNERLALYFCTALKKSGKKYGYTYKWTKELMEKDNINLPTTPTGAIDYEFMETYIRAIEKQTIQRVKDWRAREIEATKDVVKDDANAVSLQPHKLTTYKLHDDKEPRMVAEPSFEIIKWNKANRSIRSLFDTNTTILIGCYKNKKHLEWIKTANLYNIRLGNRKGSMDDKQECIENASMLILYDLKKPQTLLVYDILEHQKMTGEELQEKRYPQKKKAGKEYMTFQIAPSETSIDRYKEQQLIETIIADRSKHTAGTPIFIEP